MPGLGLRAERLHPDLALTHRLLVGLGGVGAAYARQGRFVETPADAPSPWGGRALLPERTGRAGSRRRLGDPAMGRLALRKAVQHRPAWAVRDVHFSVVADVRVAEHPHP